MQVMYLISIYFDDATNKRIQRYINKVAECTGNHYMLEGKVPPHITIAAFETKKETEAIQTFEKVAKQLECGKLTWACAGQFFPYVIYIAPVLNEYLHAMSRTLYDSLSQIDGVSMSQHYRPFQWIPHTTIGKKLSNEEMQVAFQVLQNDFGMFEGQVVKIGLAKPNPHRDIVSFELN